MTRIIFHNPQSHNNFGTTVWEFISAKSSFGKYRSLIRSVPQQNVLFYVDGTKFSFMRGNRIPNVLRYPIARLELKIWAFLNGYQCNHINENEFREDDVILCFSRFFNNLDEWSLKRYDLILTADVEKIIGLSHIMFNTKVTSDRLSSGKNITMFCEADVVNTSPFFRHHFQWYRKDIVVVHYVPDDKYSTPNPVRFEERAIDLSASGTVVRVDPDNPAAIDYAEFFKGKEFFHSGRRIFFEAIAEIQKNREIRIENTIDFFKLEERDSRNTFYLWRGLKRLVTRDRPYLRINLVDLYRDSKFVFVGGEDLGVPPIGLFECMRCGCVVITEDHYQLEDHGIHDGQHCILYDGTESDLKRKLEYCLDPVNMHEMEFISVNAYLISQCFSIESFVEKLLASTIN